MTAKGFTQAESRAFLSDFIARNGINEWFHFQALANKDDKWVVSPNNDTIYSIVAVNTIDGFTLVVPDVGDRFVSIHIVDENHMSPFYLYGGDTYKFTRAQFESDYIGIGIRMGTNGTAEDVKHIVENLQPQYKILNANPAVPVDAFFSITVYGQDKYLMADHDNIVSSNQKAIVNDDGSFTVVYGSMDCNVKGKNCLYTPSVI